MKRQDTETAPEMQGDEELTGLHEYVRERGESARLEVAKWNAQVELWRSRYGDEPIPEKVFEQHPAARMIAGVFEQSGIVTGYQAVALAAHLLIGSNEDLREMVAKAPNVAAQLLDLADLSANPAVSYSRALLYGQMATASGLLLDLRTTTNDEICGLPVENIPGCILVRTADVQEGNASDR
jgi:hypothetical protein